jgi:hypothetical protein
VQSIQAPARLRAPARALSRAVLALLVCAALALGVAAVWPHDGGPAPAAGTPAITLIGGVPIQQARCSQWLAGSPAERNAIVDVLAKVAGGASTTGGYGATLSRGETHALFSRTCAAPFARGFLLYELYNRAAAFR